MDDAVARFNRAVTSAVGARDTSFLGRGRSLGAARVLNVIGRARADQGRGVRLPKSNGHGWRHRRAGWDLAGA